MLHMIGIILTMLYGGFLIFSAYRIGVQVETWITALNVIVGALMILTLVQPWLGIIGLILALPVALINGQLIFFNINWNHFIIRIIITIGLIVMMLKYEFCTKKCARCASSG